MKAIAFDVYGTLINLASIHTELAKKVEQPNAFFLTWRQKQLEYAFRRSVMGAYKGFSQLTRDALLFTNRFYNANLTHEALEALLVLLAKAPAYADAITALTDLTTMDLYAFSNGEQQNVSATLQAAGILSSFSDVISVEPTQSFKPDPRVYQHLCDSVALPSDQVMLVSSNPFDIIGAKSFGLTTVWIKRSEKIIFDEWEIQPDYELASLLDLAPLLADCK